MPTAAASAPTGAARAGISSPTPVANAAAAAACPDGNEVVTGVRPGRRSRGTSPAGRGLRQPARGAGDAGCVVAVVAQVRRDPGERRGGPGRIVAMSGTGSPLLPAAPGTRGPRTPQAST